nr:immunoglobulin heavy chain junction region [Macaca mulatta]MOV45937.1 immunoglobulin heavy chain junction region [Macaca mulatta]
CARKNDDFDYW